MTTPASIVREMHSASDTRGFRLIGHNDLAGHGDAMQVSKRGDLVYVAHVGTSEMALSVLDCSDPEVPRLLRQFPHPPNTHRHKVQVAGDLMLQNNERPYFLPDDAPGPRAETGLSIFDLSEDPTDPVQVGFYPAGGAGVHRIWFVEPPYAHIAAWLPDASTRAYQIIDLSDPADPRLVGEWWIPGTRRDDATRWPLLRENGWYFLHGVIVSGDRAYAACHDAGMAILDISDMAHPKAIGRVSWSPPYGGFVHTTLPLPARGLVVCTDEALPPHIHGGDKRVWVVDVREERQPVTIATLPEPVPPPGSPWSTYHQAPGRFGPHNLHENQPGAFSSERVVFVTYYSGGLRVYDLADPHRPEEVSHFVPPIPPGREAPDVNDLFVDATGLVYLTERHTGGMYVLEYTDF